MLAGYDAVFLKDTAVAERYRKVLRINAHFLPEACNPPWHRPYGDTIGSTKRLRVLIAGNMYATRFALVRALLERGIEVEMWGGGVGAVAPGQPGDPSDSHRPLPSPRPESACVPVCSGRPELAKPS